MSTSLTLKAPPHQWVHSRYCHSPVIAVKNVDVRQPILLHISPDSVHIIVCFFLWLSHSYLLCLALLLSYMAIISTSDMSIPANSLLHQVCCYRLNYCCFPDFCYDFLWSLRLTPSACMDTSKSNYHFNNSSNKYYY